MISLALALALLAQSADAAEPQTPPAAEDRLPAGAPADDYQFVAWCYGMLRGYLDLHDQVMPEVKRIEGEFREPGRTLEQDLKVYADMQKDGQAALKRFQASMTAAEKASVKPINVVGSKAVRKGRDTWTTGPGISKANLAQAWMSWALPARCEKVAASLETRSRLMGATLNANVEPAPAPDAAAPETKAPEAEPAATDTAAAGPTVAPTEAPPPPADPTPDEAATPPTVRP